MGTGNKDTMGTGNRGVSKPPLHATVETLSRLSLAEKNGRKKEHNISEEQNTHARKHAQTNHLEKRGTVGGRPNTGSEFPSQTPHEVLRPEALGFFGSKRLAD